MNEPALLGGIAIDGHRALQNAAYVILVPAASRMSLRVFNASVDEILFLAVVNYPMQQQTTIFPINGATSSHHDTGIQ
jgi:hypothetical protein